MHIVLSYIHDLDCLVQVMELYNLLSVGPDQRESKAVSIYVDAWGIKRLVSLAIRRWKAPIYRLRDSYLKPAWVCSMGNLFHPED